MLQNRNIQKASFDQFLVDVPELNSVNLLVSEKKYKEAETRLTNLVQDFNVTGAHENAIAAGSLLIKVNNYLGNYKASEMLCNALIEKCDNTDGINATVAVELYNTVGNYYIETGNLLKGRELHEFCLRKANEELGEMHVLTARSRTNIAVCYWLHGDYNNALEAFEATLPVYFNQIGEKHADVAKLYGNIGVCHLQRGDFEKAESYFFKAIGIYEQLGETYGKEFGQIYAALGTLKFERKQIKESLNYYIKALKMTSLAVSENNVSIARFYSLIGRCYTEMKDYEKALFNLDRAIVIKTKALPEGNLSFAETYSNKGICYMNIGDFENAKAFFKKELKIKNDWFDNENPTFARPYNYLSKCAFEEGDFGTARKYALSALKSLFKLKGESLPEPQDVDEIVPMFFYIDAFEVYGLSCFKLYDLKQEVAYLDAAFQSMNYAIALINKQRQNIDFEGTSLPVMQRGLKIYHAAFDISYKKYVLASEGEGDVYLNYCFKLSELSKVASLVRHFSEQELLVNLKVDKHLGERYLFLKKQLGYYQIKIEATVASGMANQRPMITEWEKDYLKHKKEFELVSEKIYEAFPKFKLRRGILNPIGLGNTRELLNKGEAVLSFYESADCVYWFWITKDGVKLKRYCREIVGNAIDSLVNCIGSMQRKGFIKASRNLFNNFFGGVAEGGSIDVAGINKVVIVPYNGISKVPFETLLTKDDNVDLAYSKLSYWLCDASFEYTYSVSVKFSNEANGGKVDYEYDLAGFAPGYEFSENFSTLNDSLYEIASVEHLFNNENCDFKKYTLEHANYANLLKSCRESKMILLAAHTDFDENNKVPHLLFADKENLKDGLFRCRMSNIMDLPLSNVSLVFLNACQSASGKAVEGEGLLSLNYSFIHAGANNVISTLFDVMDIEGSKISIAFFNYCLQGYSYAEALQKAKLQFIVNEETSPINWAGFVLLSIKN